MSEYDNAFHISPVPVPGPDATAPDLFRGIYGMPAFVTIASDDLQKSVAFWTSGLGFFELFEIPGRLVHLRRWAFQDVLLVPAAPGAGATTPGRMRVSFACVLDQLPAIEQACRSFGPACVDGPVDTAWNSRELSVAAPDGVRVVFTAAKQMRPESVEAAELRAIGIEVPHGSAAENDG